MRRCRERGADVDSALELGDGDPAGWVWVKDPDEYIVQFIRQWQDCLQEITILGEGPICGILNGRLLPGITATGQVDKDDTKGPDIVGSASVRRLPGRLI